MTAATDRPTRGLATQGDWLPYVLVLALAALGFGALALRAAMADAGGWAVFLEGDPIAALQTAVPTVVEPWVTLTFSGLATGITVFLMAVGLTLGFGLLGVINFGHGAFISLGAMMGGTALLQLRTWRDAPDLVTNLAAIGISAAAAMGLAAIAGMIFQRALARPGRGGEVTQILVTIGGLVIVQQLIPIAFGAEELTVRMPVALEGAVTLLGATLDRSGLFALAVGLAVMLFLRLLRGTTQAGLIVRASVEDPEMVAAFGYRLPRIFALVCVLGAMLAGLGGMIWGMAGGVVTARMGADLMMLVFVAVLIGGRGSVGGCAVAALLLGLTRTYAEVLAPDLAILSHVGLLVLVLLWRPEGLMPRARTP